MDFSEYFIYTITLSIKEIYPNSNQFNYKLSYR